LKFIANLGETWDRYTLEAEEIVDLGEHVTAVMRMSGRGAGGDVPVERSIFVLWSFQGAKAVRAKSFGSREESGLSYRSLPSAWERAGRQRP
jgi:hypothetical protein